MQQTKAVMVSWFDLFSLKIRFV